MYFFLSWSQEKTEVRTIDKLRILHRFHIHIKMADILSPKNCAHALLCSNKERNIVNDTVIDYVTVYE